MPVGFAVKRVRHYAVNQVVRRKRYARREQARRGLKRAAVSFDRTEERGVFATCTILGGDPEHLCDDLFRFC